MRSWEEAELGFKHPLLGGRSLPKSPGLVLGVGAP
jgi:hypothetical protein